jgi:flagellar protein FliL
MGGAAAAVEAGAEAPDAPKQKGGKRKLILLSAPILVIALSGGGWFTGVLPHLLGQGEARQTEGQHEPKLTAPVFVDVPEMIVNLDGNTRHPSYLKLQAKLELGRKEDTGIVQAAMPRLVDMFQTYLRDMRPEEFRGSIGTHRLREELIARANLAASPARIINVLFTEMLVQ